MKVLFQSRTELFDRPGGDTVQMEKLASNLKKLGVDVTISNKIKEDLSEYDLVNIFNINHIVEFYPQIINAKKQNIKVVLSPIYHSIKEIERWEKENSYGFRKTLNTLGITNQYTRDHFKNLYRIFVEGMYGKLFPFVDQVFMGTVNQQRRAIELADIVLVQTNKEAEDIKTEVGINDFNFLKVVNGVDQDFKFPDKNKFLNEYKIDNFLLEVGRIEPRKNQLKVIEAFKSLKISGKLEEDVKLVFIGDKNNHHKEYYELFKAEIEKDKSIVHLGYLDYSMVQSAMACSKMLVYPSWFETTGLVAIEALLSGTRVVVSGDRAREYIKGFGEYADPGSSESIADAIIRGLSKEFDKDLVREHILNNYTWEIAARQSLNAYKQVLND